MTFWVKIKQILYNVLISYRPWLFKS